MTCDEGMIKSATGTERAFGNFQKSWPANAAYELELNAERFSRASVEFWVTGTTANTSKVQMFWGHRPAQCYESYFEPIDLNAPLFKKLIIIPLIHGSLMKINFSPMTETTGTINFSIVARS
jgi:hypothetical protein